VKPTRALLSLFLLGACTAAHPDLTAHPGAIVPVGEPAIVLSEPHIATVMGQPVRFDGDSDGLVWPALAHAFVRSSPQPVVVAVARQAPVVDVLRVGWALRAGDVQIVSKDAHDASHAVLLRAKPASPTPGCHVALFVREDGAIRFAGPNGSQVVLGDDAVGRVVREVADESSRCPMRFVAFGAESLAEGWGPVFDLILAVDAARAAGDTRYVLGEPAPAVPR
jgi:hypothetical protein